MHPTPRLLLSFLCLSVAGFAAKPAPEAADAPPRLISTKGGGPKWRTPAELEQFATKGDPAACLELADRLLEGQGTARDVARAAILYEQAARGGLANGWFGLGKIAHDGLAGEPDYARALDCFTQAARGGVLEAQHNLGAMLVSARGVRRDYVEGLAWLIVAKQSGATTEAEAQVRMRLARRPADITAAEARAAAIIADLPNATVRATVTGTARRPATPAVPPPVDKPTVVAPRLETKTPPKVVVPLTPQPPTGKP